VLWSLVELMDRHVLASQRLSNSNPFTRVFAAGNSLK
jgi:hypothetical protein